MPRHPPIALSSLSPNKPNTKKLQRCSRPLYNSQTTHPKTPPHTTQHAKKESRPHPTHLPEDQEPNSVLSGVTHSVGVPLLIRGCTDELIARLQVNVPLSSLLVSRTFAVKDPALGRAD